MIDPEKPSKLITQADYQQIGVAVRPAEFQGEIGNIIVILSSPDFVNEAEEKEMSRDEAPAAVRPEPPLPSLVKIFGKRFRIIDGPIACQNLYKLTSCAPWPALD